MTAIDRRAFLSSVAAAAVGMTLPDSARAGRRRADGGPLFTISLAEWSLHRAISGGDLDPLDFPRVARDAYGIDGAEYVNTFYRDLSPDARWTADLARRCDDTGVQSVLIMCDGEGEVGDPDPHGRDVTIRNHVRWLEAAAALGCHAIRVNAASRGTPEEQRRLVADGLHRLAERADPYGLSVLVENHGGISSNAEWLAGTIRAADHPRLGTLPDFGNWSVSETERYDPYLGVQQLMPLARAASAKTYDFGPDGEETSLDYGRLLRIVLDAGYHGRIGVEYEGDRLSEPEGIRATRDLLLRLRKELEREYAS